MGVIGVAISASLLPPAVNSGMILAFALYEATSSGDKHSSHDHTSGELLKMAFVSMLLTLLNIFIIFLSATMMFKIKDVVQTQDINQERVWDNITTFKQQHRKLNKTKSVVSPDSIVGSHDDDDDDGDNKPFPFAVSTIDAFNFDVHAKDGTNAAKALEQIENTMTNDDMLSFYGGAKDRVLRQATSIYNMSRKKIVIKKGGSGLELISDNESSS